MFQMWARSYGQSFWPEPTVRKHEFVLVSRPEGFPQKRGTMVYLTGPLSLLKLRHYGSSVDGRRKQPKHSALRAKQKSRKRREIIKAAVRVFAEIGYHGATMEDVARELEASKGLLYHHFKRKEDVLAAILSDEELIAQLEETLVPPAGPPLAQIVRESVDTSFATMRSNAQLLRVLYLQSIVPGRKAEPAFTKMLERLYDRAALWVEHYKRTGDIGPDVSSRLWVQVVLDAYTNTVLKPQASDSGEAEKRLAWKAVLEMLFDGVTTEKGRVRVPV